MGGGAGLLPASGEGQLKDRLQLWPTRESIGKLAWRPTGVDAHGPGSRRAASGAGRNRHRRRASRPTTIWPGSRSFSGSTTTGARTVPAGATMISTRRRSRSQALASSSGGGSAGGTSIGTGASWVPASASLSAATPGGGWPSSRSRWQAKTSPAGPRPSSGASRIAGSRFWTIIHDQASSSSRPCAASASAR